MPRFERNHIMLLGLTCLAIFFVNLDAIYINIMEARNFVTAREMLDDGNWIFTTLNGEPRYQKPPLPTWITAAFGAVLGMKSLIALRLPAALMSLILVLYTYSLSKKVTNNQSYAFISALVLSTSFYIIFSGRNGQWDIFTHAFMMGCIYQLFLLFTSNNNKYQHAVIAAVFFGASFMSKGPVSLYALLLPFLISFGIVYKFRGFRSKILPLIGFLVIALLLSAWWYWVTYTYDAEAMAEITRRETSNWTGYNIRPFYYYWSFFTQSGLWTLPAFIALLYPYLKNRVSDRKAYTFTLIWTLGAVVLLSVIPEKKSRYLLPVLIPMAMNTGFYVEYLVKGFSEITNKWEKIPVYFNFGLISVIGLAFPVAGYLFLNENLDGLWVWYGFLSILLFGIGYLMFRNLLRKKMEDVFYLCIAFIMAIMIFGLPMASSLTVNPEFNSMENLNGWQEESGLKVYEYGGFTPELIWAYGKPIPVLTKDEEVTIPSEESFGLLIAEESQNDFRRTFQNYRIEKVTRYDMNPKGPEESGHKPRLYRDLYLLKKR